MLQSSSMSVMSVELQLKSNQSTVVAVIDAQMYLITIVIGLTPALAQLITKLSFTLS